MDYFEKYAERLRIRGTLNADSVQERMTDDMRRDWENNPSYRQICVTAPDGITRSVKIQTTKKTVGIDRVLVHPDYELHSGDIIHSLQDFSWLVIETKWIGHVFKQANIVRINRVIKWMVGDEVYEQAVRVKAFSRVDGVDEYYFFTMPENTLNIFLPLSEKTATLVRDKRIMIDKIPYKVTKSDNITYTGTTVLFVTEEIRKATDTDEIADFIETESPSIPTEIDISGPSSIIYGFAASYSLLENGVEVEPVWSVESAKWFKCNVVGNQAEIFVVGKTENIGKSIVLTATYNLETYTKVILVQSLV